jgi:acetoin utilization deacetylase AcuC-like enzyme
MGPGHPECPERIAVIQDELIGLGLADFLPFVEAPAATRADLERVHGRSHVAAMFERAPRDGVIQIDPDTFMSAGTLEAALRAAGAVIHATDLVLGGKARNAFCNVRPPGHHAERDAAMGFCFFNNVAVGVAHALAAGLARVAVLDFDAHHGNGTENIFLDDRRVMVCSSYQHPLYPYSGADTIPGHLINTPLPPGAGGEEFRAAVSTLWLPEIERFRPEMVFVSAGFDAHAADPLTDLRFQDADYAWVTAHIVEVAHRHAGDRIVSALEGGYDLPALARCAALHVKGLMGA